MTTTTNTTAIVKPRFFVTTTTITNLTLYAAVTNALPVLPDLLPQSVSFLYGVSVGDPQGYVTFTASNSTPAVIHMNEDVYEWRCIAINGIPCEEFPFPSVPWNCSQLPVACNPVATATAATRVSIFFIPCSRPFQKAERPSLLFPRRK